jgi:riboflavin biosynthesis pyrimidine reductase
VNLECLFDIDPSPHEPHELYNSISWSDPPPDRPYVYINMASTADGKVVVGEPGGTAKGVGGPTDQVLYRRLQRHCDAAFVGGSTLRAGQVRYPANLKRITVTSSGELPVDNRFFTDAPGLAYVFAPDSLPSAARDRIASTANLIQLPGAEVDLADVMEWMRTKLSVRILLCEGGPAINDQLVRAGLADELFLTLAPKLKGSSGIPSIISGKGFPPGESMPITLISVYRDEDELYLRYRMRQK